MVPAVTSKTVAGNKDRTVVIYTMLTDSIADSGID